MNVSRGKVGAAVLTISASIVGYQASAQQRARLPAECRTPALMACLQADARTRQDCVVSAMTGMPDTCRKQISEAGARRSGALPAGWREDSFGSEALQKVDWVAPTGKSKAPLLLFVHGGGWSIGDKRQGSSQKGAHFVSKGWAFASTNYRLVPQATVEAQAADIAAAIAFLRRQPAIDGNRIVLMGHSAGAHLAALVASDPAYLQAAGVPIGAIKGVVLLDGAGYDVADQLRNPGNRVQDMYVQAFSNDPKRHAALSPTLHAAAPNAANWLILPIARRADAMAQSERLATALRAGGSRTEVRPQAGKTHATINRELGAAGDPTTATVDGFLRGV